MKFEYLEPIDDPYISKRSTLMPKKSKALILK